ncbi:MAG: ATP-binding protein [Clostridia bacterium]|nr:ATP-binding protein [Clostridia bacterium]
MERKIYQELINWKNTNIEKPLMVIGARQIGKTYIIDKFCKKEFENYIYINLLEHLEIIKIFKQEINVSEKFKRMKIYLDTDINVNNTIIFFDEIQESEELISALKYFNESEEPFKIICAGSLLGVKLKRMHSSFPVGRVKMINMYPMDFEEFLIANGNQSLIDEIKNCYENNIAMDSVLHNKALDLYRLYLCVGGMPESIKDLLANDKDILKYDKSIIENIYQSYLNDMNKYVENKFEANKIESIYKSIPSQLGNQSNKFQYGKISSNARKRDYETALNWLLSSTMVHKCTILNKVEIPPLGFVIDNHFKLYLSDVGILLNVLQIKYKDIILDNLLQYKGIIAENYVATQLIANSHSLIYWESGNQAEVDFILYNDDGIIPVEVKANDNVGSQSLNVYMKRYNPKYSIRISTKNFGISNNIKSIPLYAVFLIK